MRIFGFYCISLNIPLVRRYRT